MNKIMLGNEAVARGLYEAGVKVVSSYPGTPSTEITEFVSTYDEIYSEWASNEKVAAEAAFGACMAGARSFTAMKHVGLNVAADLLFTASYTGVNGGFVIAVADDSGMHSSQNEQDSRHYAISSKVPMLEPSDSAECLEFTKKAFEISEKFDTPVILRLSTRVSHSQSIVKLSERNEVGLKEYVKNPQKYVMMPGNARPRHTFVENRTKELSLYGDTSELNKIIKGGKIGVITSGIAYQYAREALGDKATYLKLGLINPLPEKLIRDFAKDFDKLYIIEELDPVIETACKSMGLNTIGKELFSLEGEYTATIIKEKILGEKTEFICLDETVPVRPPVLCPGCPHRGIFYVLSKLKLHVSGDIGCYTLAAQLPLGAMDSTICMGASISGLHGFNKAVGEASEKNSVAVIGDSTFIHSGITGLIDIAYNASNTTVIILDNSITGMTGHQQNPTTGFTIKGEPANAVNLEALCKAIGIKRVCVVDPFDLDACEKTVKAELAADEPSVIITRRPCALLKSVKPAPAVKINAEKCKKCKMCLKIGCPAIKNSDNGIVIDSTLCTGCGLCKNVCKFGAIE
ncbi:MAG: indolepyruvate ferredoxin oxidoreductase subunit alpha [Ruminococcaceae bacterium]|nr:indolepyruvate ferredoxin oxidoreductase subunit alpha [Oscillospiraceae bacterium]